MSKSALHNPVMLGEVLNALNMQNGERCIDCTFGYGGYTRAILNSSDCSVIAFDRDESVLPYVDALSQDFPDRFRWICAPFSALDTYNYKGVIHAVVLDIGVSSMQLDQAERGFSFMRDGPLDMRMSSEGVTAADAINVLSIDELIRVFKVYGEEPQARRIAQNIVKAREAEAIVRTEELASLIETTIGRRGKIHPATRVFQALRIFVNDELGELYRGLCAAERILEPGGRLVVVTFHSLEDRILKKYLVSRSGDNQGGSRHMPEVPKATVPKRFELLRHKVIKPSREEIDANPRARSAKLRVAIRTSAAAGPFDDNLLPRVPQIADVEARL